VSWLAPSRVVERNVRAYRRGWLILTSGLAEPVLYLFAIGVGVGTLVGDVAGPGGRTVHYDQFVAPAMLVTAAMNGALADTTFNFFTKFKYAHAYDAMLATPLRVKDMVHGEVTWSVVRGGIYATSFFVVMVVFGLVPSRWGLLAVPIATLVSFGFASVGLWATTYMRSFVDFDFIFLAMAPLLVLSGTFFPLERYPDPVAVAVQATPLYQGVILSRSVVLGDVHLGLIWHAAYLAVMGWLGIQLATRRLGKLLLP